MLFADRVDAGPRLAARLEHLRGEAVAALGLPRGDVPVAPGNRQARSYPPATKAFTWAGAANAFLTFQVGFPSAPNRTDVAVSGSCNWFLPPIFIRCSANHAPSRRQETPPAKVGTADRRREGGASEVGARQRSGETGGGTGARRAAGCHHRPQARGAVPVGAEDGRGRGRHPHPGPWSRPGAAAGLSHRFRPRWNTGRLSGTQRPGWELLPGASRSLPRAAAPGRRSAGRIRATETAASEAGAARTGGAAARAAATAARAAAAAPSAATCTAARARARAAYAAARTPAAATAVAPAGTRAGAGARTAARAAPRAVAGSATVAPHGSAPTSPP